MKLVLSEYYKKKFISLIHWFQKYVPSVYCGQILSEVLEIKIENLKEVAGGETTQTYHALTIGKGSDIH